MVSACFIITRGISTSCANYGKRNFRKFLIHGKRGSRSHKIREAGPNPELPIDKRGVRDIGVLNGSNYVILPEKIPELIVPSLKDCKLKPYVTYESENVYQTEFTAEDLFNAVYLNKIVEDFKNRKLDSDGKPLHPSEEEKLTPEEAKTRALKTGTDIFQVDKEEVIAAHKKILADSLEKAEENRKKLIANRIL